MHDVLHAGPTAFCVRPVAIVFFCCYYFNSNGNSADRRHDIFDTLIYGGTISNYPLAQTRIITPQCCAHLWHKNVKLKQKKVALLMATEAVTELLPSERQSQEKATSKRKHEGASNYLYIESTLAVRAMTCSYSRNP